MTANDASCDERTSAFFNGDDPTNIAHRAFDWSRSPCGPITAWPLSLRSLVGNVLPSRMPMMLWWGPGYCQLYNDAFAILMGEKHPGAIGQSAQECWAEVWDELGALADRAFAGESVYAHELPLLINRHGYDEESFWTFSFSPVRTATGAIEGVLVAAIDATEAVVRGRRLSVLRDIGAISSADGRSVRRVLDHVLRVLEGHPGKVAFAVARGFRGKGGELEVVQTFGVDDQRAVSTLGDPVLLREVIDSCEAHEETVPAAGWPVPLTNAGAPVELAMHLPIIDRSEEHVIAVLTVGINPHRAFDDDYRGFLNLMARQVSTAATDARAIAREKKRTNKLVELDREKNRFLQNISHELRTPLTLITGSHRSLGERTDLSDGAMRDLAVAERGTLRLTRVVEGLLDLARSDEGVLAPAFVPTDLGALTAEIAAMFRSTLTAAGLTFDLDIAEIPEAISVDPEMWSQIVSNLLSNAYKFTDAGGVTVALSVDAGDVCLVVSDTGVGMTTDEIERVFERFHQVPGASTRTAEGAGIGLALVHDLTTIHDGHVDVESKPGHGTRFTVRIPARDAHPERHDLTGALRGAQILATEAASWARSRADAPANMPSSAVIEADGRPIILVVEDNPDLQQYLCELLADEAWQVRAVADVPSALTVQFVPELVLSDVLLPGIDGIELVRFLRQNEETAEVPIVLLTALAGPEAAAEGLAAGATDYLAKPFDPNELRARVRAHAELHRRRRDALQRADAAVEGLEAALATNRQIGAAIGIIMTLHGRTQNEAFQMLSHASQNQNRKLRDVADDVVFTGEIPEQRPPR